MVKFKSKIFKIDINPVVDPPERVLQAIFAQAGRSKGPIPVRGMINGAEFVQTLVKYRGAWRLYINAPMLKASGSRVGDVVGIEIMFDPEPREVIMPKRLAEALSRDPSASIAFEALSPYRQKEILKYLGSLKTEASFERNVERLMRDLRDE